MPQGKGTYGSKKGRPPKKASGYAKGGMKEVPKTKQKDFKKLPEKVRQKMGFLNKGGMMKKSNARKK